MIYVRRHACSSRKADAPMYARSNFTTGHEMHLYEGMRENCIITPQGRRRLQFRALTIHLKAGMKAAATVTIPFLMAAQLAAAAAVPSVINILKPLERCGDGCVRVRVDSKPLLRGAADRIIIAGNLFQKSSKSDDSLRFEYKVREVRVRAYSYYYKGSLFQSVYAPSTTATLRLSEAGEIVRGRIAVSVSASAISGMEQKERAVAEIHAHYDDDSEIRHVLRMIPENSPVVDSGQERVRVGRRNVLL